MLLQVEDAMMLLQACHYDMKQLMYREVVSSYRMYSGLG